MDDEERFKEIEMSESQKPINGIFKSKCPRCGGKLVVTMDVGGQLKGVYWKSIHRRRILECVKCDYKYAKYTIKH